MFTPLGDHHLDAIVHFFIKRLGLSYYEILKLPKDVRDNLWKLEQKVIEEEAKNNKKSNSRSRKR